MRQLIVAFSLMFLVISATVLASQMSIAFTKLDINADGQISLLEAKSNKQLVEQFDDLDENENQQLSEQEFTNFKTH
ncbi:MAG: hypothetical protein ACTH7Q_08870 [Pseudoalteromonas sp.]